MNKIASAVLAFMDVLGGTVVHMLLRPISQHASAGLTRMSRLVSSSTMPNAGRAEARRIIVYHHSSFPHVDNYLEVNGTAHSIGVKRLSQPLKTANGKLTQSSKDAVLSLMRKEYEGHAWLAASTDHTPAQARSGPIPTGYGAGPNREVISDIRVNSISNGQKIEFVDWEINPNKTAYIFKIMKEGPNRSKNILAIGLKSNSRIEFEDRLHLKFDKSPEEFLRRLGSSPTITLKEDGASSHFVINKNGFRAFSPRISKETGERIEYTAKLGKMADATSPVQIKGMGELLFRRPGIVMRRVLEFLHAGELADRLKIGSKMTFSEIGGILNANRLPPEGVIPELMVYRIDGETLYDISRLKQVTALSPNMRPPTKLRAHDIFAIRESGEEGAVGIPLGKSISEGRKFKPLGDTHDWCLENVDLKPGENGGIAGVIWFRSESGRRFKVGAPALGERECAIDIMTHPDRYIGRVFKMAGLKGHEGRAMRWTGEIHTDK